MRPNRDLSRCGSWSDFARPATPQQLASEQPPSLRPRANGLRHRLPPRGELTVYTAAAGVSIVVGVLVARIGA